MLNTDYIQFIGWTSMDLSIGDSRLTSELVQGWGKLGYQLTDGLAWPFSVPNNLITDEATIRQRILAASDLSAAIRRSLNLWQQPLEFDFYIVQQLPEQGVEWMLEVETDTFFGPNYDLGEINTAKLIQVIETALDILPTHYGCLFSVQDPPSGQQVYSFSVDTIYPLNFFGAEYVRRIGREMLRVSPAQYIREVRNGLLIVPALETMYGKNLEALRTVQRHVFGNEDIGVTEEWI